MSASALGASQAIQYLPAGSMVDFAGTSAPAGWLMCDGRSLPAASYPDLFAVIGYSYGGSGANFSLPDFRGRFARYMDNMGTAAGAAGRDAGRALGNAQEDAMQGHQHFGTTSSNNAGRMRFRTPAGFSASTNDSNYMVMSTSSPTGFEAPAQEAHNHTLTTSTTTVDGTNGNPRTSAETRPINLSCNRIIKY